MTKRGSNTQRPSIASASVNKPNEATHAIVGYGVKLAVFTYPSIHLFFTSSTALSIVC
jgi:hypothetical protein